MCFILNKTCDCIVAIGVNVCHHDVFPPCTGGELGKELVNHSYVLSLYSSLSTASSLHLSSSSGFPVSLHAVFPSQLGSSPPPSTSVLFSNSPPDVLIEIIIMLVTVIKSWSSHTINTPRQLIVTNTSPPKLLFLVTRNWCLVFKGKLNC